MKFGMDDQGPPRGCIRLSPDFLHAPAADQSE